MIILVLLELGVGLEIVLKFCDLNIGAFIDYLTFIDFFQKTPLDLAHKKTSRLFYKANQPKSDSPCFSPRKTTPLV
jgi:hypothetical protein